MRGRGASTSRGQSCGFHHQVDTQRAAGVVSGAGEAVEAASAAAGVEGQVAKAAEEAAADEEADGANGSGGEDGSENSEDGSEEGSEDGSEKGSEGGSEEGLGGAAARLLCEQLSLADIVLLNKQVRKSVSCSSVSNADRHT